MQLGFAHSSGCASDSLALLGAPKKEVYFMAIIDILTPYDAKKKAAHAAKTVKHGVSSLPPAGRMGFGASASPACLRVYVSCLLTLIFLPVWKFSSDPVPKNSSSLTYCLLRLSWKGFPSGWLEMSCIYVPVWEVLDLPGVALTASQSRNRLAAGRRITLPPSWGQSCSLAAILNFPKGLEKSPG